MDPYLEESWHQAFEAMTVELEGDYMVSDAESIIGAQAPPQALLFQSISDPAYGISGDASRRKTAPAKFAHATPCKNSDSVDSKDSNLENPAGVLPFKMGQDTFDFESSVTVTPRSIPRSTALSMSSAGSGPTVHRQQQPTGQAYGAGDMGPPAQPPQARRQLYGPKLKPQTMRQGQQEEVHREK